MKVTVARFAFVALIAALVGVFIALVVYVTLVAAVIFLAVAAVGTAIAFRQKKRLAAGTPVAPERIERR